MTKTITLLTKPIPLNQKYGIINGRQLLTKKYRDTKEALAWEIASQVKFEPLEGMLAVNVMLYFGDKRKRDIDSYLKILLDSMSGIVYVDDCQIIELHVFKEIDLENPRTVIQIL